MGLFRCPKSTSALPEISPGPPMFDPEHWGCRLAEWPSSRSPPVAWALEWMGPGQRVGKDMLLWPLTRPYRVQHLTLGHMVSVIADILRGPGCPPRQVNAPLKHSVFHLPIFHATRIGESIFALHRALHLRRSERVNASFSPCLACQGAQLSCGSCLSLAWFAADWIGSLTSSTSGL